MELTFLGRGAGFNPAEGSTSAYFIDNGELFLIDCGESVFCTLLEKKILDNKKACNIFITHTHSDHVGSLGSLILYLKTVKKVTPKIIISDKMGYIDSIRSLLGIFGVPENMYTFSDIFAYDGVYSLFKKARYLKTGHCDELESYGILFETDKGLVFYSGDINNVDRLLEIINGKRKIDKLYIDSNNSLKPSLHHISIHMLNDIIPPKLKPKVWCMHINNNRCAQEAGIYGFNVVGLG